MTRRPKPLAAHLAWPVSGSPSLGLLTKLRERFDHAHCLRPVGHGLLAFQMPLAVLSPGLAYAAEDDGAMSLLGQAETGVLRRDAVGVLDIIPSICNSEWNGGHDDHHQADDAVIPESAGATPFGIFLLADDYLRSARLAATEPRLRSKGPVRLMSYHAAELFLKAYMRSSGETIEALRAHGHDLASMLERARTLGLKTPPQVASQAKKMKARNDYVRVRYVVSEDRSDTPAASVLRFTEAIRASVVVALDLDEFGAPKGKPWLGEMPTDYPVGPPPPIAGPS